MYVLDTDMSIFALRHHPEVKAHFEARSPADIAVTTMTEAELYFGARNSRAPEASRRDVNAFLRRLRGFLSTALRRIITPGCAKLCAPSPSASVTW